MKIKKLLGLLSFMLLSSAGLAQTEDISPDPLLMVAIDTLYDTYSYDSESDYTVAVLFKRSSLRRLKESNAVNYVKLLITGKIRSKDLEVFKNTIEYWEINANIRMNKHIVLPAVKGIRSYMIGGNLKLFDFAKHTPNLEVLSISTSSMIPVLPPKLRALELRLENSKWDGVLPEAFFNSPTLDAIGIGGYRRLYKEAGILKKEWKTESLTVYLPELKQDNYTLKKFMCNIDISVPGNIDKLTKLKGLKALEISFKEVPSEEELKKLSYIDYIVVEGTPDNLTREEKLAYEQNVNLLAQRLGKKKVPHRYWPFTILH